MNPEIHTKEIDRLAEKADWLGLLRYGMAMEKHQEAFPKAAKILSRRAGFLSKQKLGWWLLKLFIARMGRTGGVNGATYKRTMLLKMFSRTLSVGLSSKKIGALLGIQDEEEANECALVLSIVFHYFPSQFSMNDRPREKEVEHRDIKAAAACSDAGSYYASLLNDRALEARFHAYYSCAALAWGDYEVMMNRAYMTNHLYEKLHAENPEMYAAVYTANLNLLALAQASCNQQELAYKTIARIQEIMRPYFGAEGEENLLRIWQTHFMGAQAQLNLLLSDEAEQSGQAAYETAVKLSRLNRKKYSVLQGYSAVVLAIAKAHPVLKPDALSCLEEGLAIVEAAGVNVPVFDATFDAMALRLLGFIRAKEGRTSDAMEAYRKAQRMMQQWPSHLLNRGVDAYVRTYEEMAELMCTDEPAQNWPDLPGARRLLREAIARTEAYRDTLRSILLRQQFLGAWQRLYGQLVDVCLKIGDVAPHPAERQRAFQEAVDTSESSRARLVVDMLAEDTFLAGDLDQALVNEYWQLRRTLDLRSMSWSRSSEETSRDQDGQNTEPNRSKDKATTTSSTPPVASSRDAKGDLFGSGDDEGQQGHGTAPGAQPDQELNWRISQIEQQLRTAKPDLEFPRRIRTVQHSAVEEMVQATPGTVIWQFIVLKDRAEVMLIHAGGTTHVAISEVDQAKLAVFSYIWSTLRSGKITLEDAKHELERYSQSPDAKQKLDMWEAMKRASSSAEELRRIRQSNGGTDGGATGDVLNDDLSQAALKGDTRQEWDRLLKDWMNVVGRNLLSVIWSAMEKQGVAASTTKVLIIPHLTLHLLPFHGCALPDGRLLGDAYSVTYAPNLTLAHRAWFHTQQYAPARAEHYLFTANSREDLPYAELEGRALQSLHPHATALFGRSVVLPNLSPHLPEVDHWAHSAHATYRPSDPLRSGIHLADSVLTLNHVFTHLRFKRAPLVCLIGCETNFLQPTAGDDPLSIATSFLFAGARCVVSTLWRVNDLSAALWSIRFHRALAEGHRPALAADMARQWLRGDPTAPGAIASGRVLQKDIMPDLIRALGQRSPQEPADPPSATDDLPNAGWDPTTEEGSENSPPPKGAAASNLIERCQCEADRLATEFPETPPFAHPSHWAPFVISGWGY